MRSQLDSISLTVHEVTGRMELAGRQLLMLEDGACVCCVCVLCRGKWGFSLISLPPPPRADRDRMKAVIQTQDEVLNQKIRAYCPPRAAHVHTR